METLNLPETAVNGAQQLQTLLGLFGVINKNEAPFLSNNYPLKPQV